MKYIMCGCVFISFGLIITMFTHSMSKNTVETQQPIETVIVTVRGCDIIQLVQDDKLITAFPAPDQPKTCKVREVVVTSDKPKRSK